MGRLPSNGPGDSNDSKTPTLAERLEAWRSDPEMCLIWSAFCGNSALQLADGLRLAKTKRASAEVLGILTGRDAACTDGSMTAYSGVTRTSPTLHTSGDPNAVAAPPTRPRCRSGSRGEDEELSTLAPTSAPISPQFGPLGCGSGEADEMAMDGSEVAMQMRLLPSDDHKSNWCPQGGGAGGDAGGSSLFGESCCFGHCAEHRVPQHLSWDASTAEFHDWSASPFAGCIFGRRFLSANSDVRLLQFHEAGVSSASASASASASSSCCGNFAVVAKIVPITVAEKNRYCGPNERKAWLCDGELPAIEDLQNEIAVLLTLQRQQHGCIERGPFFVQLLGSFRDDSSLFMVMEYCEGGDLLEKVNHNPNLCVSDKKRYIAQILEAVHHLHERNIGHRDVSLENVVLRGQKECVLVDFAQAVPLCGLDGTPLRYFVEAGKRIYRAPEMYVPRQQNVQVVCPSTSRPGTIAQISYDKCRCEVLLPPDAVPGRPCLAETAGYAVAPADVFSCGVCAFMLLVGRAPWSVTRETDPTFSFVRRHGVKMLLRQWRLPGGLEEDLFLSNMLQADPVKRSSIEACLRSDWIADFVSWHFQPETM